MAGGYHIEQRMYKQPCHHYRKFYWTVLLQRKETFWFSRLAGTMSLLILVFFTGKAHTVSISLKSNSSFKKDDLFYRTFLETETGCAAFFKSVHLVFLCDNFYCILPA